MSSEVRLSEDGRYVYVTHQGRVSIVDIKAAKTEARPLFNHCDRMLVDYRQAKLSHIKIIEIDNLGLSFKNSVPLCEKVAFVRAPAADDRVYSHLINICCVCGVETELFETLPAARNWLLETL
ncbi:MAG: hypothetical protein ACJAWL_001556 [Motiliproteus sp.]|jgi:hypothetical protein